MVAATADVVTRTARTLSVLQLVQECLPDMRVHTVEPVAVAAHPFLLITTPRTLLETCT